MGKNGKPGASLRVWRDYFPNAHVYGADIDENILFEEDRIKTFHLDQTSPGSIAQLWDQLDVNDFDFMIDDGLHYFDAGICLFENSISKLAKSGTYVIEDVPYYNMQKFQEYFSNKSFKTEFVRLVRPNSVVDDNWLVVIRNVSGPFLR